MALPLTCPNCQTFVRADWTTRCESCGCPFETTGPPTARKGTGDGPTSSQKITKYAFIGVPILAALLCGGAIAAGAAKSPTSNFAKEAANIATSTTTSTVAPESAQLELQPNELNAKWTSVSRTKKTASELAGTKSGCFPTDPLMNSNVSYVLTDYSYNLQSSGLEGGHLNYGIRTTDSSVTADHQQQRIASKAYETCVSSDATQYLKELGASVVTYTSLSRVTRNLPVAYVDYKFSATVGSESKGVGHSTVEDIFMQHGNARIKVEFLDCSCKLGPPPDKDAIIRHAADKLAALPAS